MLLFHFQALLLLLKPTGVVALVSNALAAIKLQDPPGNVVQEVSIMRHGNDGSLKALQMLLKPRDAFRIQVVGWFVKQQNVGLGE